MDHIFHLEGKNSIMELPEKAIETMLFHKEIQHEKSSHVGSDSYMLHTFKYKD